jgi:PAS domain S-box-containing protein
VPGEQLSGRITRRAALILLPLALGALCLTYLLYASQVSAIQSVAQATEDQVLDVARQRVTLTVASVVTDASYLSEQDALQSFLTNGDPASLRHLEAEYLTFANHREFFDQIRLLDLTGREIVRVNRSAGEVRLVPADQLQDRSDRYDTKETLKLGNGQAFVSPFDLNVEAGAIELPVKPTIRIGVPVFDHSGSKRGIIVINYLAQRILDRVHDLDDTIADIWLVNSDGYWLLGPNAQEAFAFMYPDRTGQSFAAAHPEVWRQMQAAPATGRISQGIGQFAYVRADVNSETMVEAVAPPHWFLVIFTSNAYSAAQLSTLRQGFGVAAAVLVLLMAAVSLGLARHQIQRHENQRKLQLGEARFRDLLESAPDAVFITDRRGEIQLVNAQAERLFGYGRTELIGQEIEKLMPSRYRGDIAGHDDDYLAAAGARPMGAGLELHGLRKDGLEFPVSINLSPAQTDLGPTVFWDVRDITDRRASEVEIQDLNRRLEQDNAELNAVNKELEAFSYSVSHDLRAPLRAIDGFSQALIEDAGPLLTGEHQSHLNRVRQAAQRMGVPIDDLIKLARVTRAEMKVENVDMSAVARQTAADLQDSAPERQAEFIIAPDLRVEGDPRLLQVALDNLLNNSWKFTAPRSPARIEFGRTETDGGPAYFVRDNGVGFDMSYAGKMFGAFQRFHDVREFSGTGIGLATVQRIIHKHGGRIWAESRPGDGATFYFML